MDDAWAIVHAYAQVSLRVHLHAATTRMGVPMRTHKHAHTHAHTHTHTHIHIHKHGNQSCWEKFRRADASPESYLLSETRFCVHEHW
jgi:hypothetical protein